MRSIAGSPRTLAVSIGLLIVGVSGAWAAPSQVADVPAFSGSASADGARVVVVIPGAPATDTPVDSSGPTAQAAADSIGGSTGYAAFPAPGDLVISAPGLVAGLVTGPNGLPSPPNYPLYVHADSSNPEASVGAGPYALEARSQPMASSAKATGGLEATALGNAVLVASRASIGPVDGGVVATATSDVQNLTIGPLTIGQIKTTATQTMDASGTVTPSSTMEINGARLGGIPLSLTPDGLVLAGPTVALPVDDATEMLSELGITIKVLAPQELPGRVVAPALQIRMPIEAQGVGSAAGTMTVTAGTAAAALSGSSPLQPSPAAAPTGVPPAGSGSTSVDTGSSDAGLGASAPVGGVTPGGGAGGDDPGAIGIAPLALVGLFDVRSLYLMLTAGAIATIVLGQLIRLLGVRRSWTSTAG